MKTILLIVAIIFSVNSFANIESTCDFYGTEGISQIKIASSKPSTNGYVQINYINGEVEKLAPQKLTEGSFNQVHYPNKISNDLRPHVRNLVFVKSNYLGDVKISFTCSDINSDVFCQTRAGHQPTTVADFNIKNNIYNFKNQTNPCTYEFVRH